jgi:hypothetical protein
MKKEYEEDELQAAASALALMILRIRDGKTRDTVAHGVLRKLTKELMASAKAEGGYPDSDDDDDEDGEADDSHANETQAQSSNPRQPKTSIFIK